MPPHDSRNDKRYTFLYALGPKGSCGLLDERIVQDMKELTKAPFDAYDGQKMIRVQVHFAFWLADRPERSAFCDFGSSSSQYASTGFNSIRLDQVRLANNLRSCAKCCRRRREVLFGVGDEGRRDPEHDPATCKSCCDWNLRHISARDLLTSKPPAKYPRSCDKSEGAPSPPEGRGVSTGDDFVLGLWLVTFEGLKAAVKFAHHNTIPRPDKSHWGVGICRDYLRTCGCKGTLVDEVVASALGNHAVPISPLWDVEVGVWAAPCPLDEPSRNNPSHFLVETIMHLVFLGIVKSSVDLIDDWLKNTKILKQSSRKNFSNLLSDLLGELGALQLDWLRTLSITSQKGLSTASWVSEDQLGYSRVLPALYWNLEKFCKEGEKTSAEFRAVKEYVLSLHALVVAVMARSVTEDSIKQCENVIKVFLSCTDTLDTFARDDSQRTNSRTGAYCPFWLVRSNHLCLLQLPGIMRQIGPPVAVWEGGYCGERFLQLVKPYVNAIKRSNTNWPRATVDRYYANRNLEHGTNELKKRLQLEQSMGSVDDEDKDDDGDFDDEDTASAVASSNRRYKMVRVYGTPQKATDSWERKKPISAFKAASGGLFLVCRLKGRLRLLEITKDEAQPALASEQGEMAVFQHYSLATELSESPWGSLDSIVKNAACFVTLIPPRMLAEEPVGKYCVVNDSWRTYDSEGSFRAPWEMLSINQKMSFSCDRNFAYVRLPLKL